MNIQLLTKLMVNVWPIDTSKVLLFSVDG